MASRVAVAGASALVFFFTAIAARGAPAAWERSLLRGVASLPDWLGPPFWVVMQAGTRAAVVLAVAFLVIARRTRTAVAVGAAGGFAWLVAVAAKDALARPRPTAATVGLLLREHVDGHGFPSSHAAIAAALAVSLVYLLRLPAWSAAALVLASVLVGAARLYVGVHWPLDVVGGLAVGVFTASAAAAVAASR